MTILIITQDFDPTVDPVVEELSRRSQEVVRFDLADFPLEMTLVSDTFSDRSTIDVRGRTVDLGSVSAVWYRRPTDFWFGSDFKDYELKFAMLESSLGIGGTLQALDCLWVNRPSDESVAGLKPYQLHLARKFNLQTPRTLITNDPDYVRKVVDSGEDLIYKLISPGLVHDANEMPVMVHTTLVSEIDDNKMDRVAMSPCLFQELVPKACEIRLTIMGSTYLPVTILSQEDESTSLDWRKSLYPAYGDFIDVPKDVLEGTRQLMKQLNLAYAAVDFIVRPDGEWVFLEVNPMGQFMWLEEELGIPMSEKMADLLSGGSFSPDDEPVVVPYELPNG